MEINIDRETYRTEKISPIISEKKLIVLGDTMRTGLNHIKRLNKQSYSNIGNWSTYTIDKKGVIYEHFDPRYISTILGDTGLDKISITILLENMNWLYYDNGTDAYYNWANEKCLKSKSIIEKEFRGYRYWDSYTIAQMKSLIKLCKYLCETYDIDKNVINNSFFMDIINFEGILCRSNLDTSNRDVNPSFDFSKLEKGIKTI
jgi:hypothetical protein